MHEVFFDQVSLIAEANNKLIETKMAIDLHDMPKDGFATDFNHGLGPGFSLFGYTGAETTGKNDNFHQFKIAAKLTEFLGNQGVIMKRSFKHPGLGH